MTLLFLAFAAQAVAAPPGDANESECGSATEASPGFRAYLPDCRAYELVTPPYKEGFELIGVGAVSREGAHVIAGGIGAFAESQGTSAPFEPNVYEFSRVEGVAWEPTPLAPPTSTFSASEFIFGGVSSDLSKTLWVLHTPQQSVFVHDLYVREGNGTFTKVGPALPESVTNAGPTGPEILSPRSGGESVEVGYTGVSQDLTHVLFTMTSGASAALWPGDTTKANLSLYEYAGTNNAEPALVGVKNKGHLAGKPHLNEGAELIGQCGTTLGSGHADYNAISEDGARVFFTPQGKDVAECAGTQPALQELYVRENMERTEPISARSASGCSGACATSTPRDANFEGASRDGSKVFFTSTQQLLNEAVEDPEAADSAFSGCSKTIGSGGCNLYEYDFNEEPGHRLVLVSRGNLAGAQVQGVVRISGDGSHIYFVAKSVLTSKNNEGKSPESGADNLYVFNTNSSTMSFVAVLSNSGLEEEVKTESKIACKEAAEPPVCEEKFLTSLSALWSQEDQRAAEATPDGNYLIFSTSAHLTADDHSNVLATQMFAYDAETGHISRVSIGQRGKFECSTTKTIEEGFNCNGNVQTSGEDPQFSGSNPNYVGGSFTASAESRSLNVSENGGLRVVFQSSAALTPGAASSHRAGCDSIYEYRPTANGGEIYLISDGEDLTSIRGQCGALSPKIDAEGQSVLFETGDRLVPQDTDTQRDIYAARIGGGFPAPPSKEECVGDGCQGALSSAPSTPSVGSAAPALVPAVSPPPPAVKPKAKKPSRAAELATALRVCRKKRNSTQRKKCESQARKRYAKSARAPKRERH